MPCHRPGRRMNRPQRYCAGERKKSKQKEGGQAKAEARRRKIRPQSARPVLPHLRHFSPVDNSAQCVENVLKAARARLTFDASFQSIRGVISRDTPYPASRHGVSTPETRRVNPRDPPTFRLTPRHPRFPRRRRFSPDIIDGDAKNVNWVGITMPTSDASQLVGISDKLGRVVEA